MGIDIPNLKGYRKGESHMKKFIILILAFVFLFGSATAIIALEEEGMEVDITAEEKGSMAHEHDSMEESEKESVVEEFEEMKGSDKGSMAEEFGEMEGSDKESMAEELGEMKGSDEGSMAEELGEMEGSDEGSMAEELGEMKGSDEGSMAEAVGDSTSYDIDVVHSTLGFTIKHLGISTTRGSFTNYAGSVEFDPNDYSSFKVGVDIQAASIDTNNETRDNHLKSADFFDVANHSQIKFVSNRLEKRGDGAVIIGDLTMKGITKNLTIPVTISGPISNPMGGTVMGITGQGRLNRQEFNIKWNKDLDNGGLMVDNIVNLIIEIEAKTN